MQLLLDTHALIWWLSKNSRLSTQAYQEIANPHNIVFVSAASAWEIAIKKYLKKLEAPDDLAEQIEKKKFRQLPITVEQALTVEKLPLHHQDPFDRLLIAQAKTLNLTIVTRDRKFDSYDVDLIKC
ncbi:type II toxin-antitoxin system VapC family toxin [Myxosarcina sp. GI1]|uniref:type II toxin-antitoxin system VapC family toxin n=1 Tax=Myxosarcina sp. GI1 TaxID=1541065 RepID=UPI00069128E5|nr:type II toxin-antitoxin system VapC family toxin [Myxosarcina sp. GI1]